jgi:hypothetical protein
MQNQRTAASLTESRIKQILDLHDQLRRMTKKDAKKFLQVTRLPDVSKAETLEEVVAPQMAKYFAGSKEDPVQFFKDRDRLLMIFHAIKAGGVGTLMERYSRAATGDLIRSGVEKIKAGGLGNPAAAEEMLQQATKYAEKQVRLLRTISDAEVRAVSNCMQEIEDRLFSRQEKPYTKARSGGGSQR